ncbi:hypothetical protein BDP55DRAFT_627936 [Colletotrichum godetiae]|uniref:Uncharacterized protein n=1 Tax=Colletotrichum godetiae TaxID=1209918 RepID=A0AAJ0ATU2_9PEZI|nr:uncharacterized protein BDP55DRAFT_627936 [Colletotrichum godetiae]KAK1690239.1 hypothetical protein BDP55DRAFT_627936 [Colletotrichum godetiae]
MSSASAEQDSQEITRSSCLIDSRSFAADLIHIESDASPMLAEEYRPSSLDASFQNTKATTTRNEPFLPKMCRRRGGGDDDTAGHLEPSNRDQRPGWEFKPHLFADDLNELEAAEEEEASSRARRVDLNSQYSVRVRGTLQSEPSSVTSIYKSGQVG